MLPLVQGRPATRKRWPEGVEQPSFFVKDLERRDVVAQFPRRGGSGVQFPGLPAQI